MKTFLYLALAVILFIAMMYYMSDFLLTGKPFSAVVMVACLFGSWASTAEAAVKWGLL